MKMEYVDIIILLCNLAGRWQISQGAIHWPNNWTLPHLLVWMIHNMGCLIIGSSTLYTPGQVWLICAPCQDSFCEHSSGHSFNSHSSYTDSHCCIVLVCHHKYYYLRVLSAILVNSSAKTILLFCLALL